jgi:outer membrane protein assembly factor BamB
VDVGKGHASPIVVGDRVYLLSRQGENEVVSAFELATGKVLWKDTYPAAFSPAPEARSHGSGPFATPTLHDGRLYTFGINEILSAYDAKSGKLLWRNDYGREYATPRPYYGTSASPLLVDGQCIVQVGGPGKGALVALDAKTGQVRWKQEGDGPGYGSPVIAEFSGVRQIVTPAQQNLVGTELATGKLLWQMPFKVPYDQNIITPVVMGDVFITSGEDTDLQAIRVAKKDGRWTTEKVWSTRPAMLYMSSPVLSGGLLYGFSAARQGYAFALDPKTGEICWKTEGNEGDSASVVAAGDFVFFLGNDAVLRVVQKTGEAYKPVARYTVADGATWAQPVVMDGRILVKDADRLILWTLG